MPNYGLNFGYRRSGGDSAVREGRLRVPKTGTFRQGELVTQDPADPDFLKHAPAGAAVIPGVTGLLIQHDGWDASIFEAPELDTFGKGGVRNNHLAVIQAGPGEKIWLKNTPAQSRWDGRAIAARTVVVLTGVVVGDTLQWDGAKFVKTTTGTAALRVTVIEGTNYAEAVLLS